jgi:phosphate transport system protein
MHAEQAVITQPGLAVGIPRMTAHFVNLLDDLRRRSLRMASQVEDMVEEACEAVFRSDEYLARRVIARDSEVDAEEVEVEKEIIRLMAQYQPVGADLRLLCTVLKVNNDLERIADCAVNIAERARKLDVQSLANANPDLRRMGPLVRRVLRAAVHAYNLEDENAARIVLKDDAAIDVLYQQIARQVVSASSESPETVSAQLDLLAVAKALERIADHAMNIAEDVIFLTTGAIVRHGSAPRADRIDADDT